MTASIAKDRIKQILERDWSEQNHIEQAQRDVSLLLQAHDLEHELVKLNLRGTPHSYDLLLRASARRARRQWAIIAKLAKIE